MTERKGSLESTESSKAEYVMRLEVILRKKTSPPALASFRPDLGPSGREKGYGGKGYASGAQGPLKDVANREAQYEVRILANLVGQDRRSPEATQGSYPSRMHPSKVGANRKES